MRILVISNNKSLASLIVHGLHSSMPAGTMFSACDVRSGRDRLRMWGAPPPMTRNSGMSAESRSITRYISCCRQSPAAR